MNLYLNFSWMWVLNSLEFGVGLGFCIMSRGCVVVVLEKWRGSGGGGGVNS